MKFWPTLAEATKDLDGVKFMEHEPLIAGGQRRWPIVIQTATVHDTPQGNIKMRKEEYGWRIE